MMIGIELVARRAALGLSQGRLADVLGVAQSTISSWEKGQRTIPEGIDAEVCRLEDARRVLMGLMVDAVDSGGTELLVHTSDESFWAAYPDCSGLPREVQLVAAALARHELDDPPPIRLRAEGKG